MAVWGAGCPHSEHPTPQLAGESGLGLRVLVTRRRLKQVVLPLCVHTLTQI